MIVVCEPQCIGLAHEKLNAAFLYGLSLAYHNDQIIFYAEKGHLDCVSNCLRLAGISLSNIEYRELRIPKSGLNSLSSLIKYYIILNELFERSIRLGALNYLFLSINTDNLYVIKYLRKRKFKTIRCAMVLHGVAETLKHRKGLLDKIRIVEQFFQFNNALTYAESDDFIYISLSPYITSNLVRFARMNENKFVSFHLPYLFSRDNVVCQNTYLKLGILGKGYPSKLRQLALQLNNTPNIGKYEINVISIHSYGLDEIPNINCVSPGSRLSRQEIDFHVRDIDYVLFLYDQDSYELSASGALFDAISYEKPIIYLKNRFIQSYDQLAGGLGIRCSDLNQMKSIIAGITINYDGDHSKYLSIVNNIKHLKNTIDIKNQLDKFHHIFNY